MRAGFLKWIGFSAVAVGMIGCSVPGRDPASVTDHSTTAYSFRNVVESTQDKLFLREAGLGEKAFLEGNFHLSAPMLDPLQPNNGSISIAVKDGKGNTILKNESDHLENRITDGKSVAYYFDANLKVATSSCRRDCSETLHGVLQCEEFSGKNCMLLIYDGEASSMMPLMYSPDKSSGQFNLSVQ